MLYQEEKILHSIIYFQITTTDTYSATLYYLLLHMDWISKLHVFCNWMLLTAWSVQGSHFVISNSVHKSCVQHCDFTSLLKPSLPTRKFVKSCKFLIHNYVINESIHWRNCFCLFYLNIKKVICQEELVFKACNGI